MKVAIIYTTISGNTERVAEIISEQIVEMGGECDLLKVGRTVFDLSEYDVVLFGTYTWGDGILNTRMRNQLRRQLIDNEKTFSKSAVFGSGDTQYHYYCRGAEEVRYHLDKHGIQVMGDVLKIEQYCSGTQVEKVKQWVIEVLEGEF